MAFRASAAGSSGTNSTAVTIPSGASVGDVAYVLAANNGGTVNTFTPPTGWTAIGSPDVNSNAISSQLFSKTLVSGDPGTAVTFSASAGSRMVCAMEVFSSDLLAGAVIPAAVVNTTASTSVVTPAGTTVAPNSDVVVLVAMRSATSTAGTLTAATGYTSDNNANNGAVTPTFSVAVLHLTTALTSGTAFGGDTFTANVSVTNNAYAIALAPPVTASLTETGSGADTLAVSLPASLTEAGAGSDTLSASVTAPLSDPGTVADALSASVTAPLGDTGAGADALSLTINVNLGNDSATGADALARRSATAMSVRYPKPGQYPQPSLYPGPRPSGSGATSLPTDAAELLKQAVRGSLAITYTVDASLGGKPVLGAQGMTPTGGNITDTMAPGVRRVLSLDLAPAPGLFDLLAPSGVRLNVLAHIRYTSRATVDIPMGVFDIDTETLKEGGGGLSLTAPDKWVRIQRAKFARPQSSVKGMRVVDQIKALIQGALGATESVTITATSTATVGALVWDIDRDRAILDLAAGIGAWVYFDRTGAAHIEDLPTLGTAADWLVDASRTGVLLTLDRTRSRTSTYNVVAVHSSAASGAAFPDQYVWDNTPTSPTYAGPDPLNHPELAGPFGVVVYHFDTPLPLNAAAARQAGLTVLARTTGLASQASLGQVPNPAMDAGDVLDVLAPRERRDLPRALERHMVDTVTHSLDVTQPQTIQTRSTRTDAFT